MSKLCLHVFIAQRSLVSFFSIWLTQITLLGSRLVMDLDCWAPLLSLTPDIKSWDTHINRHTGRNQQVCNKNLWGSLSFPWIVGLLLHPFFFFFFNQERTECLVCWNRERNELSSEMTHVSRWGLYFLGKYLNAVQRYRD